MLKVSMPWLSGMEKSSNTMPMWPRARRSRPRPSRSTVWSWNIARAPASISRMSRASPRLSSINSTFRAPEGPLVIALVLLAIIRQKRFDVSDYPRGISTIVNQKSSIVPTTRMNWSISTGLLA